MQNDRYLNYLTFLWLSNNAWMKRKRNPSAAPTAHLAGRANWQSLPSVAYHSRGTTNTGRKSSEWMKSWHEIKANSMDEPLHDMHVLQRVNRIRVVGRRPCWACQAGDTWMQWRKQNKTSENMRTSVHRSFRQLFVSLAINLCLNVWDLIFRNFVHFMVPPESIPPDT